MTFWDIRFSCWESDEKTNWPQLWCLHCKYEDIAISLAYKTENWWKKLACLCPTETKYDYQHFKGKIINTLSHLLILYKKQSVRERSDVVSKNAWIIPAILLSSFYPRCLGDCTTAAPAITKQPKLLASFWFLTAVGNNHWLTFQPDVMASLDGKGEANPVELITCMLHLKKLSWHLFQFWARLSHVSIENNEFVCAKDNIWMAPKNYILHLFFLCRCSDLGSLLNSLLHYSLYNTHSIVYLHMRFWTRTTVIVVILCYHWQLWSCTTVISHLYRAALCIVGLLSGCRVQWSPYFSFVGIF